MTGVPVAARARSIGSPAFGDRGISKRRISTRLPSCAAGSSFTDHGAGSPSDSGGPFPRGPSASACGGGRSPSAPRGGRSSGGAPRSNGSGGGGGIDPTSSGSSGSRGGPSSRGGGGGGPGRPLDPESF